MYIIKEVQLECGCCLELTVSKDGKTVKVKCHSLEEGMSEAKKRTRLSSMEAENEKNLYILSNKKFYSIILVMINRVPKVPSL